MWRISFLILSFLAITVSTSAQPFYFKHYQVEAGLSYNSVFCSLQDRQGFMWFGTRDGLNRFDGYRFKVFRNIPSDSSSLGSNFIFSLFQQDDSLLWVGTSKGLFQYRPATEKFSAFTAIPSAGIRDIQQDASGNLWAIAGMTLLRHQLTQSITKTYARAIISDLTSLCVAKNKTVWAATNTGQVCAYDARRDDFVKYDVFSHSPQTSSYRIEKIVETDEGNLLVATSNQGVKLFNTATKTYVDLLTYNADKTEIYARDFVKGPNGDYWIATESGLYVYNLVSGQHSNLQKSYTNPYSLSDNAVYTLCKDKEGGIWAGTYFGGVNHFSTHAVVFQKFYPEGAHNSLHGNVVREIAKDKQGNFWIGTEDAGLNKLNPTTGEVTSFSPTGRPGDIAYTNIHGLLADGDRLWIGTYEHGLDVMDIPSGKVVKHYRAGNGPYDLKSNFIVSFCKASNGTIYIATRFGLYRYNVAGDNFSPLPQVSSSAFVYSVIEDHTGTVWATTLGEGIFYFNPKTGKADRIKATPANGLGSNNITSVYEDSKGNIWFTTEGSGVSKYNHATNAFTNYSTANLLPSNFTFKVMEDNNGTIWISTSKGLVALQRNSAKVYTQANGLLSDQFNYNSGYRDEEGKLYFGSVKGLISFQPKVAAPDSYNPPVYITNFQVANKDGVDASSSLLPSVYTKGITLAHNESTFSIDFAALSFTSPEMTVYQYRMDGLDKGWMTLPTNRRVYFTQLSPGRYTFRVRASTDGVDWTGEERTLKITVNPPLWATGWAYTFYTLLLLTAVVFLAKEYHRRTQEKAKRALELLEHEKEKELYQAKIDFFTNVAHEIRTPLTLIRAPMERLMKTNNHPADVSGHLKLMDRNTNRLLELTGQLLDFRKAEANGYSLNFVRTDVSELLAEAFASFGLLAEKASLCYSLELPPKPLTASVDVDALEKIINNLLDNAVKYAAANMVVALQSDEKEFRLLVKSDGVLIPAALAEKIFEPFYRMKETEGSPGSGIGLSLARSLAELHNGKLIVTGEQGFNVFCLTLPLRQRFEFDLH